MYSTTFFFAYSLLFLSLSSSLSLSHSLSIPLNFTSSSKVLSVSHLLLSSSISLWACRCLSLSPFPYHYHVVLSSMVRTERGRRALSFMSSPIILLIITALTQSLDKTMLSLQPRDNVCCSCVFCVSFLNVLDFLLFLIFETRFYVSCFLIVSSGLTELRMVSCCTWSYNLSQTNYYKKEKPKTVLSIRRFYGIAIIRLSPSRLALL